MQTVTADLVKEKKVLLRLDLDVPLANGTVLEDFRLKVAIPTLKLCLENAKQVIIMGHIGRPKGEDANFSVGPIYLWLQNNGFRDDLVSGALKLLENLRFEEGEDQARLDYARELASLGDFYVNEAFAAHHSGASTMILPTLLPHAAGLRFAKEVDRLTHFRENRQTPLIAVVGGAKVDDKYPAIISLAKFCDKVLVGGLLPKLVEEQGLEIPENVVLAKLNDDSNDLSVVSLAVFLEILEGAKQVIWAGPVGQYENPTANHGNIMIGHTIIDKNIEAIIGGGDTIAALEQLGLLEELEEPSSQVFLSVGGGASLKFLADGTLPTIQALK